MVVALVESSVTATPLIEAPAPMVRFGAVSEVLTPWRVNVAFGSPVTRINVPSPLPATVVLPMVRFSWPVDTTPDCCIDAPGARLSVWLETRMISLPESGVELSFCT